MLNRRTLALSAGAFALVACAKTETNANAAESTVTDTPSPNSTQASSNIDWANLTDLEWKKRLTDQEYRVLRHEGTERPFSSPLNENKAVGTYVCAGCALPLFTSEKKYDSGTGWPSFFQAIDGALKTKVDRTLFVARTEYHCARCGGHQGHVFNDGPQPTGLRYCNNGVALDFIEA